jgi:hypothetical protein
MPSSISQFKTVNGVVDCKASPEAVTFVDNAEGFIEQYRALYTQLCRNNKRAYVRAKELASLHESSSQVMVKLGDLLSKHLNNNVAGQLYQKLSVFSRDISNQSLKLGAVLNEYLNKEIKYQAKVEPDAFLQYHALVQVTRDNHEFELQKLTKNQDRLFQKGYSTKWQVESDEFDVERATDREYAEIFMLPVQRRKVEELGDEVQYFTQQMYSEVKRIVDENIKMQSLAFAHITDGVKPP